MPSPIKTLSNNPTIAIIGAGKLGCSLVELLLKHNYQVKIGTRKADSHHASRLEKRINKPSNSSLTISRNDEAAKEADLVLITVQDEFIEQVCESIVSDLKSGSIVAHCSGVHDSSVLASALQANTTTCSLHPLNTFPTHAAASNLFSNAKHQTFLYGEGEETALKLSFELFTNLGFICQKIETKNKALYHAASVVACNYLVALMDVSLSISKAAGMNPEQFWSSLQPIIASTINNIDEHGTHKSLSGPIARGDANTVTKHIEALNDAKPELTACYVALARHSLSLVEENNQLKEELINDLQKLLH